SKGGPNAYNQAIVRSGDLSQLPTPVSNEDEEPDYYYVVTIAGQSNSMSYGEGLPMPKRSNIKPGGFACKYNEIIPADHCLHDVQDMTKFKHPKANDSEYGCVGQGLHIG
ncbi:9-O-acetyl-N-acetylneuraminic acid deacetylase, partial [Escherichia coli]